MFFASAERLHRRLRLQGGARQGRRSTSAAPISGTSPASRALDKVVLKFRREGAEVEIVGMNEASATIVDKLAIHDKPGALDTPDRATEGGTAMTKIIAFVDGSIYARQRLRPRRLGAGATRRAGRAAARARPPRDVQRPVRSQRQPRRSARAPRCSTNCADARRAARQAGPEARPRHARRGQGAPLQAAGVGEVDDQAAQRRSRSRPWPSCETDAALIVIGKRGEGADFAKLHLGSNLERVVRAMHKPVLVASRAFKPVERF